MKLEQFLHVKLLKNDVSKENLVKFRNHVKSKPLEPVLWNFASKNHKLCAFRWYKAELHNMSILGTIKVSFVAVVFDDRVHNILKKGKNSRKSVTWSAVPDAPKLVYVGMRL